MNPIQLLTTIDFTDKKVSGYSVNCINRNIELFFSGLSDGNDEVNGKTQDNVLVFEDVLSFKINPSGILVDDRIQPDTQLELSDGHYFMRFFSKGMLSPGVNVPTSIEIIFKKMHWGLCRVFGEKERKKL